LGLGGGLSGANIGAGLHPGSTSGSGLSGGSGAGAGLSGLRPAQAGSVEPGVTHIAADGTHVATRVVGILPVPVQPAYQTTGVNLQSGGATTYSTTTEYIETNTSGSGLNSGFSSGNSGIAGANYGSGLQSGTGGSTYTQTEYQTTGQNLQGQGLSQGQNLQGHSLGQGQNFGQSLGQGQNFSSSNYGTSGLGAGAGYQGSGLNTGAGLSSGSYGTGLQSGSALNSGTGSNLGSATGNIGGHNLSGLKPAQAGSVEPGVTHIAADGTHVVAQVVGVVPVPVQPAYTAGQNLGTTQTTETYVSTTGLNANINNQF